jgi:hypothetical protein
MHHYGIEYIPTRWLAQKKVERGIIEQAVGTIGRIESLIGSYHVVQMTIRTPATKEAVYDLLVSELGADPGRVDIVDI